MRYDKSSHVHNYDVGPDGGLGLAASVFEGFEKSVFHRSVRQHDSKPPHLNSEKNCFNA